MTDEIKPIFNLRAFSIVAFIFILSLNLLWSVVQPLYGSPDETAHVVKAVATASGQFGGEEATGDFGFTGRKYEVPVAYSQGIQYLGCILGPNHADASCVGPFASGRQRTAVASTAAHYPPTYYMLVGPIGLLWPGASGMYLMRLVSSSLSALVITLALRITYRHGGPLRTVGVLFACTPMVFSLSGAVNPHGLEIASSILYWVSLLTCLDLSDSPNNEHAKRNLMFHLLAATALFATIRPASFVWMSLSTFCVLMYFGLFSTTSSLIRIRTRRPLLLSLMAGHVLSVVLYLSSDVGSSLGGGGEKGSPSTLQNLRTAFDRGDDYFRYMFGWFGWVEFSAPPLAFFLCVACIGIAVTYTLFMSSAREMRAVFFTLAATVSVPILLEGLKAASSGFGYQGRYTLALAVGIPILAFWRREVVIPPLVERRLVPWLLAAAVLPSLICLDFALKRYSVGETGPRFWFYQYKWLPPGGLALIVFLTVKIVIAIFAL